MTNVKKIETVLARMAELLRLGSHDDWAEALDRHRMNLTSDPVGASEKILAMYGGMGSLNDLILYADGQPLSTENSELDELRIRLYELCHASK